MKVLVVGAGFAGLAAAQAARRAGATVTVAHAGAGSSALYAGIIDGSLAGLSAEDGDALGPLARDLGLRLSEASVLATREGVVRSAAGADAALLDLTPLAGKLVGVVDVARDDWDGALLARAFASSPWAVATATRFEPVALDLLTRGFERRTAAFDFATSFDPAAAVERLGHLLAPRPGLAAWMLGPWLGVERSVAAELSAALGMPVGEVTSPPGGPAGGRFERRRDAWLASLELSVETRRVLEIAESEREVRVRFDAGSELRVDAVVLAVGGFVSGAVEFTGALSGATPAGYKLAIAGLPALEIGGQPAWPLSSLFSDDVGNRSLEGLERAGLSVTPGGRVLGMRRLFAAGDVVAGELPSAGFALRSGLRAGRAAATATA